MCLTLPCSCTRSQTYRTALWLCVPGHGWCTVFRISICLRSLSKSATGHLQKIRQLSRNGICCMIALFLISISACDFHLKLLIHMLFAMKLSVCFYRAWAPPYWTIFPLSRESDWKRFYESTPRVTKIMRSRETFSLNLQWRCGPGFGL